MMKATTYLSSISAAGGTTIDPGTIATQVPPTSTGGETSTTKLATSTTTQASTVDTEGEEPTITCPTFKIDQIVNSIFSSVSVMVF